VALAIGRGAIGQELSELTPGEAAYCAVDEAGIQKS